MERVLRSVRHAALRAFDTREPGAVVADIAHDCLRIVPEPVSRHLQFRSDARSIDVEVRDHGAGHLALRVRVPPQEVVHVRVQHAGLRLAQPSSSRAGREVRGDGEASSRRSAVAWSASCARRRAPAVAAPERLGPAVMEGDDASTAARPRKEQRSSPDRRYNRYNRRTPASETASPLFEIFLRSSRSRSRASSRRCTQTGRVTVPGRSRRSRSDCRRPDRGPVPRTEPVPHLGHCPR